VSKKIISILDYSSGNAASIKYIISKLGLKCKLTSKRDEILNSNYLIIPGVGSYDKCVNKIFKLNLKETIKDFCKNHNNKLLGICVGMQILSSFGYENKKTKGLDLISGKVDLMNKTNISSLPHIGWNTIQINNDCPLTKSVDENDHFYFVHSYIFRTALKKYSIASSKYLKKKFTCIVSNNKNIYGTQFHPERSQNSGLKIFKNFFFEC
jgi:imidazole glycerol-phosphate synthase subunit HisH